MSLDRLDDWLTTEPEESTYEAPAALTEVDRDDPIEMLLLPFEAAHCSVCGVDVGAGLGSHEDTYGREYEYEVWSSTWRLSWAGGVHLLCEDCAYEAEQFERLEVVVWSDGTITALRAFDADGLPTEFVRPDHLPERAAHTVVLLKLKENTAP